MKICGKCKKTFKTSAVVDGKRRVFSNRQYCLDCSPFGRHNTKKMEDRSGRNEGTKVCSKCKTEKELAEFYRKNKSRLQSWCRTCLYASQKQRWIDRKKKAIKLKGSKCSRCGYDKSNNSLCFHHKEGTKKEFDWNQLRLRSWKSVLEELDKCQLLCLNCHGEMHEEIFERST